MDSELARASFDLVVLDVMMPGEDGLSACRRLSASGDVPVLVVSALGTETDRVIGLEVGADDYLAKPYSPREALARIRAILRRSRRNGRDAGSPRPRRLAFDRWTFDLGSLTLTDGLGREQVLTTAESRLLVVLLERPRIVLSRDRLLELTSGREPVLFDRAIDNQISRLRRKIESDPSRPRIVKTVRGIGYYLAVDVSDAR
ncbi:MAG: response regulator [Acuticoccus sp.]